MRDFCYGMLIAWLVVLACVAGYGLIVTENQQDNYSEAYADIEEYIVSGITENGNYDCVVVYDASDMTPEILDNREGTVVIERLVGIVIDGESGDGFLLNSNSEDYNYISYKGISSIIKEGSTIVTYVIYNPETDICDDILERYDFVLY